jgi:integrase
VAREFGRVETERVGRWVYHTIVCRIEGKRYRLRGYRTKSDKRVLFRDPEQAHEALGEIRADIRNGLSELQAIADFLPVGAPEMTFRRHYLRFVKAKVRQGRDDHRRQLSDKRIDELRGHERRGHLDPLLDLPIESISYGVLEDWRDWLFDKKKLSPGSVHHLLADVGTCLRWLRKRKDLAVEPELPEVQVPEYAPKIPTPEAQDRLLAAIPWDKRGAFLARGYMGLRPSEAARANVEDYDFDRDLLTVHGKGNRVRFLPVDGEVARWVHNQVEPPARLRDTAAPARPLFPNPDAQNEERRWTPAAARRVMLAAMTATGLKLKPNEALRHCFATNAAARDVDIEKVGFYLGHADCSKTTKRYVKLSGETLVDVPRHGPRPVEE